MAPGEFLTLLGPSGSGKTTLLMMIAGFVTPTNGAIRFGDRVINETPPEKRNFGMVFQGYALFPHLAVARGISLRHLADQVRCTEGFLSKVENNETRPSLATLHRLMTALEINVASLFVEKSVPDGPVLVMRNSEHFIIKTDTVRRGPGVTLERLVSNSVSRRCRPTSIMSRPRARAMD